ncbi:MAG TPA: M4 family metallopeptidase [Saprospiraceae bacterium]|nr:M4 family metallopeptidase [Saprospiraceae bacterium]
MLCIYGIPINLWSQQQLPCHQQGQDFYQKNKHRNKYTLADIPQLQEKVKRVNPDGSMQFFDDVSISDNDIINYLNVDEQYTFDIQNERASRFDTGLSYFRFQQFYRGIKVEHGGYVIKSKGKLPEGNFDVRQFTPFLFYGIDLDTKPVINEDNIVEILGVASVEEMELIISDRFKGTFQLIWKVHFKDPLIKCAWIDAQTGETLMINEDLMHKNAPTEDYSTKPMQDVNIGPKTFLQTEVDPEMDGGVITYDFDLANLYEINVTDFTSNLIPAMSSANSSWINSGVSESVFQAHWIVTNLREKYLSDFGIDYQLLHIGANCDNYYNIIIEPETLSIQQPTAGALTISTLEEGWIIIGHNDNSTLAEFDVLGHEMGHVFLNEFLDHSVVSAGSLHEGIADMFGVYMESEFQSLDWEMGDNVPFIVRDLQNPFYPCFNQEAMSSTDKHKRSTALGYWFYSLVTEGNLDCGDALDMKTVLEVIIEALSTIAPDADYPELCTATLEVAEQNFGSQSIEYTSILGAWQHICVNPTGGPSLADDLHITTDTPWSTDRTIDYDVYVEDGATLTISAKMIMVPGVDIFVEDDSKLIVDGGTLTTEDCLIWNGIHVAGEFDQGSFAPYTAVELKKGTVIIKNGSLIERADIAIDAKDRFVFGEKVFEIGGGVVEIENSTIKECHVGVLLARNGWGHVIGNTIDDDLSIIDHSIFEDCSNPIYSEYNIGLELRNTTFTTNKVNYIGYSSKVIADDNIFGKGMAMLSPHPVVPGSEITNNEFGTVASFLSESQGNYTPLMISGNILNNLASQIALSGEMFFRIQNNEFNDTRIGIHYENTGDNISNFISENAFNNLERATIIYGENDVEYHSNCFSGTTTVDIELNDGASIHETQGKLNVSAGNCFEDGARIQTGVGTQPFSYWTKDGFSNTTVCEYPGTGNFTIKLAQNEEDHDDCGIDPPIPPGPSSCECGQGANGCINSIASIRTDIIDAKNNEFLSGEEKELLLAQYQRCLDDLIRQYILDVLGRGDVEDVISYLSIQPEFRYRIMAYGIMNHNLEFDRSRDYIDTLTVSQDEEEDFVTAQKIYLDYITDIDSFILQPYDKYLLRQAGEKFNPYAGYARSIFYILTHEWIIRDFRHLDNTVTQKSTITNDPMDTKPSALIFPNPTDRSLVNISIKNFIPERIYNAAVFNAYGEKIASFYFKNDSFQVILGEIPGVYILVVSSEDDIVCTKRIVRI